MLVTAFEASDKVPTMEFEVVVERLLHEERKRGERSVQAEGEAGLHMKSRRGPVCYKCMTIGHIKRNCQLVKKSHEAGKRTAHTAESDGEVTFHAQYQLLSRARGSLIQEQRRICAKIELHLPISRR
jgi:hypothetical protein